MISALSLCLAIAAAPADPTPIRIAMVVAAIDNREPSASELEQTMAETVEDYAYVSLIKSEELFVLAGQSPLACGPDLDCLELRFRRANADLGLLVVLTAEGEDVQLDWRLIDVRNKAAIVARHRALLQPQFGLRTQLSSTFEEVMNALGLERLACLELSAEPSDSTVSVLVKGGTLRASGLGRHCIPAGEYRLKVFRDGYVPLRRDIALSAGAVEKMHLSLEAEPRAWYQSPWFWGAVGVVVVGGVTAGVVAATSGGSCVCVGQPGVECPPCP